MWRERGKQKILENSSWRAGGQEGGELSGGSSEKMVVAPNNEERGARNNRKDQAMDRRRTHVCSNVAEPRTQMSESRGSLSVVQSERK